MRDRHRTVHRSSPPSTMPPEETQLSHESLRHIKGKEDTGQHVDRDESHDSERASQNAEAIRARPSLTVPPRPPEQQDVTSPQDHRSSLRSRTAEAVIAGPNGQKAAAARLGPYSHHAIDRRLADELGLKPIPELPREQPDVQSIVRFASKEWVQADVSINGEPPQKTSLKVLEGYTPEGQGDLFLKARRPSTERPTACAAPPAPPYDISKLCDCCRTRCLRSRDVAA